MAEPAATVQQIGIVGVGTIGAGIARLVSALGAGTVVVAPRPGGLERAARAMQAGYTGEVKRGRLSPVEAEAGLARLRYSADYAGLAGAEFVIESVPEALELKQQMLAAVEANTGEGCIFCTNTSSIAIHRIAAGCRRPGNVIGAHYFWPADRNRLVEVTPAAATSPSTVVRTVAFMRWQGKIPLLVRDLPGFFTSRILLTYVNEAIGLVLEGAAVEAVDEAMTGFGWAMGPFRMMDAIGTDKLPGIYDSVSEYLGDRVGFIPRLWPLIEAGHYGYKGGRREGARGWYLYPEGRQADPRAYELLGRGAGPAPDPFELAHRPVWQMVNEVANAIAEGAVASPEDADLGTVLGLGWPPIAAIGGWPQASGGPMAYARQVGPAVIVGQLRRWAAQHGPRFTPAPLLLEMAA
ncbi:MAG: hypothetical protein HY784_01605 [Chloroflexi bacterium]|nr:hypothetical protein [Chloroflexota bacterium]